MLKKTLLLSVLGATSFVAHSATFNLTGNYRFGANLFNDLDLAPGNRSGAGTTTAFVENRFLLRPDVVIDDRFTARSEFVLLQGGPNAKTQGPEAFGMALGADSQQRNGTAMVYLRRAWLDWASDWGVFSVGRQPKNWGLGLLYNSGSNVFDDFGTTVDRVGFRALLGNLGLNIGYEKASEGLVDNEGDDAETYEVAIDYSNPESLFDVGLLYNRNVRSMGSNLGPSSHNLSVFSRKRWNALQLGGEFANITYGSASVLGALAQLDYMPNAWNFGLDVALASGGASNHFSFHPNYRPFLLLFNQSLGTSVPLGSVRGGPNSEYSAVGNAVGSGDGNGAIMVKGNVSYAFDPNQNLVLGSDFGYATLARQGSNAGKFLGVETDLHLAQKWYDNFKTSYALGFLFPGAAYGNNAKIGWGLQIRGALNF